MRNQTRIASALLTAMLAVALPCAAAGPPEVAQYMKLYRKARKAQEAGRHAKAAELADRLVPLAPANPGVHLMRAESLAALGQADAAFAALDRAIELGYAWPDTVAQDERLAPLGLDPRWAAAIAGFERNEASWLADVSTLHGELPASTAGSYDSLEALVADFDVRLRDVDEQGALLGWPLQLERRARILDEKLAAIERYLAGTTDPASREAAALEAVHTAASYKRDWGYWEGDAALVAARAERFLTEHPQSEHRAEVTLQRAEAAWKAHGLDDRQATLGRRSGEATEWLARLEADHAGTDEAWRGRVWGLAIEHERAGGAAPPEQLAAYDELAARLGSDEALADYAWQHAFAALFRIEGERGFDAVDLSGKRWTWEAMRGRVVLIDFWATWCGPCIVELPHLKAAYADYHDRGFEIVGVSLDHGSRKSFEKGCAEHGIAWPQIWDGQGWDAELARRFHIRGVPTPVLLDRDGNIAAVEDEARGERLAERVAALVAPSD
jgi:thiol-disulfide isomerase/thioredoxin